MTAAMEFAPGNYRFLPSVFQYSGGVAAQPGYQIKRVRFRTPVPVPEGFDFIQRFIRAAGRPATALCACELRSPAPFTEGGFLAFNETYAAQLARWGLLQGHINPVARSNVCPEVEPPATPSFHAFCFTIETSQWAPTFVVSGSGEAMEGLPGNYADRAVRRNETTPDAIRDKARFVVGEMERRLDLLGFDWHATTIVQVYTVHDFHGLLPDEIVRRGAGRSGVTWHYARPPLLGLEYEMDCAGVNLEVIVDPAP